MPSSIRRPPEAKHSSICDVHRHAVSTHGDKVQAEQGTRSSRSSGFTKKGLRSADRKLAEEEKGPMA